MVVIAKAPSHEGKKRKPLSRVNPLQTTSSAGAISWSRSAGGKLTRLTRDDSTLANPRRHERRARPPNFDPEQSRSQGLRPLAPCGGLRHAAAGARSAEAPRSSDRGSWNRHLNFNNTRDAARLDRLRELIRGPRLAVDPRVVKDSSSPCHRKNILRKRRQMLWSRARREDTYADARNPSNGHRRSQHDAASRVNIVNKACRPLLLQGYVVVALHTKRQGRELRPGNELKLWALPLNH